MKYKIYDGQLHRYAFENKIFKSKQDAIEQLISFFSADIEEPDLSKVKKELEQTGEFAEMVLEKVKNENEKRAYG